MKYIYLVRFVDTYFKTYPGYYYTGDGASRYFSKFVLICIIFLKKDPLFKYLNVKSILPGLPRRCGE